MIVFDLACGTGHVFEAWFGTSDDFEDQRDRGLLNCPICGASDVSKAMMAPNVAAKGNSRAAKPVPMRAGTPSPTEIKALLAALATAQAKALDGSEHVGRRFAEEARAIHDGEAEERPIHGEATHAEAKALIDEGVPVAPLLLPLIPPRASH